MDNNLYKELLQAKIALCKMICQFMYRTDYKGQECFYDMCESAGEAAFDILGIENDIISIQDFYHLFDSLNNEFFILNTGEKCEYSYEQNYLDSQLSQVSKNK